MTSKCKTCGYGEYFCATKGDCEKFQLEDEVKFTENEEAQIRGFGKALKMQKELKQKKGSSEEKVWKDYLNHVKNKQKKGCGKEHGVEEIYTWVCGEKGKLCPSCSNQSPHVSTEFRKDKPEGFDSLISGDTSGTQSPRENSQTLPFMNSSKPEDTSTLSDDKLLEGGIKK